MNESISSPFIRYPIATSLLMAGILFIGLVSYPLLPVAPLPQVDFPTIQISASLPGASPETMASSVAQPLERQFAQIPGVAQMTSTSSLGSTAVTIQFDLNRSIDGAANDVQAAINAASGQLPKNLPSPPTYRKVNPADSPILLLSATSDTLPLTEVSDDTDAQLAQQISQISGVAQVTIGGQQKPAVRIQIDPGARRSFALGQPPQAFPQIPREVPAAIAMNLRVDRFDLIEYPADLCRRQRRMRQIFAELIERRLEVNVVFPKRVVRVENQKLPLHPAL